MEFSIHELVATGPMTLVALASLLVVVAEALFRDSEPAAFWISVAGLALGLLASLKGIASGGTAYGGMVTTGGYADFCAAIFTASGLLTMLLGRSYLAGRTPDRSEHYSLVLLSVVGMILMASAADLVILFLGLELMSVCFYVLAGYFRSSAASIESSLKYFLLGAFATGFLLYGIALLYGTTGGTRIQGILDASATMMNNPVYLVGLGLFLIGFTFKIAAVPFHMWVPDVYEGAPTTVSGLFSTGGKASAFAVFLLVFTPALLHRGENIREAIAILAALSMIVGNVLAVAQESIKRMLAYSSIAHAGYILTGLVAANSRGGAGVLFYLASYTFMNIGAFGVLALLEDEQGTNGKFDDYRGLASTRPLLAGLMALFMFSLTGIPPFAGFFAKYYVFTGAVSAGYTWLVVLGVLTSLVSVFYYLRLVVVMYFRPSEGSVPVAPAGLGVAALAIAAVAVLTLGLWPGPIIDLTTRFF